jgi:excisionase family DNA binding protein
MVTLEGMITVAEAARRLNRSIEQVRRYLREGKLRGQRIGNQWFVEERCLEATRGEPLVPPELAENIRALREEIRRRHGTFDVVALVRKSREEH